MTENLLVGLTAIVVFGIGAQWLGWRLRFPSILILLLFGFLAGPVLGLIDPDSLLGEVLFPVVSLSVALILFEGGLTLRHDELPHIRGVLLRLISIGAVITWVVATLAARLILNLSWSVSILLGQFLSSPARPSSGRCYGRSPQGRPARGRGGILIDPVGAVLAVLVLRPCRPAT